MCLWQCLLCSTSRASLTVRITVKNGDHAEAGKIWENRFFTGKMDQRVSQKQPKVGKHVPRSHGNLPKLHFVHYSSRGSRFSKGFASNVLKCPNKDFSRAAFSYFSLPHFQTYLWASHSYRGDSLEQNNLHSSQLTGRKLPNILSYNTYMATIFPT